MLAFLPQFVDSANEWPVTAQLLALGAVQKVSGFLVMGLVALGAGAIGGWLARHPGLVAWQERFADTIMMNLGLRLAFASGGRPIRP
jgi:threonine/homoserine/homoserine lactone efflux protein